MHSRCIPCHKDVVEDLVRHITAPATKAQTVGKKEGRKEGLLPVRGLSILKTDSRGRYIPCHADVVEDLVEHWVHGHWHVAAQ